MTGFELRACSIASDRSTNLSTTTSLAKHFQLNILFTDLTGGIISQVLVWAILYLRTKVFNEHLMEPLKI